MLISRAILVNCWPFLASVRAFLCLIDDHLECPDIFSPLRSLTQLQAHHSVRAAPQNPAILRRDFIFRRAHRLLVDADPALARKPAGFALAAGEPSLDKELRDGPLTRCYEYLLGPGAAKGAALTAVIIRRDSGMELMDERLGEPLFDVFRIHAFAEGARLIRDLGRSGIGRQ